MAHCHIAWHQSQGLALQIVENESQLQGSSVVKAAQQTVLSDTCASWNRYTSRELFGQDDSGI